MGACHDYSHRPGTTAQPRVAADQTVGEVAGRSPRMLEILQHFGINHCCGARLTLAEAAASAGVDLRALLAALSEAG